MAPKLFITGATGYIGGDALHRLASTHPDWDITALVRGTDKGTKIALQYSSVKLVYGTLDDTELIERESKAADIVGDFASADHPGAVRAILQGLASRENNEPGFLIHISGTGILLFEDLAKGEFGTAFTDSIYDDLDGVGRVTSLPDSAPHRLVDKLVLEAGGLYGTDKVKTAIVSPPAIYGPGRGPDSRRSAQLPELCRVTLEKGHGIRINQGKTHWSFVHVHDLSDLFLKLFEEAAAGGSTAEWPGKPDVWGPNGYFFCENGEHVWGEVSQWVADEGEKQGLLKSNEVKSISAEEAASLSNFSHALWGGNSRSRARRARELFQWNPTGPSVKEEISNALKVEANTLGLSHGHAEVAAGTV